MALEIRTWVIAVIPCEIFIKSLRNIDGKAMGSTQDFWFMFLLRYFLKAQEKRRGLANYINLFIYKTCKTFSSQITLGTKG